MKAIANKENDLDKMLDKLEKVEKTTREKTKLLDAAREDKILLTREIEFKEQVRFTQFTDKPKHYDCFALQQEIRRVKQALDENAATSATVATR